MTQQTKAPPRSSVISFKVKENDKSKVKNLVRKWLINKGYTLYDKSKKAK